MEGGEGDEEGDAAVGQGPDLKVGGADEKLGRSGFKKNEVERAQANQFREFDQARHKKSGKDLLDELVGGDEDDHLLLVPTCDAVDVVIDHTDEGELEDEPRELDDDPSEKISAEAEFAGNGEANLNPPEVKEGGGRVHGLAARGGVFTKACAPKKGGEENKEDGPTELEKET